MSDNEFGGNDGGSLRKQLEEVLAANKSLRDKVEQHEAASRRLQVENFLSSQGLPADVAKFVPADVADPKAMENWVAENGKLFAAQSRGSQNSSDAGEQQTKTTQDGPVMEAGSREAWTRIERVAADGNTQPVDLAALESQLMGAKNPGELMSLMRQYEFRGDR